MRCEIELPSEERGGGSSERNLRSKVDHQFGMEDREERLSEAGFALFVENLSRPAEFLGQWEQEKKRKRNREAGRERWTTAAIVSMDGQDRSKTR